MGGDGASKGQQLRTLLEELLVALGPGATLPSERVLAERYGLARMTVRKELDRLVAQGAVYRLQGRGTFVADLPIVQSEALTSFSEDILARGMTPGARVLAQELVGADGELAGALERAPGSVVVRLHRLRLADGLPMAIEWAFLPAEDFPGLERAKLGDRSLYEHLRRRFGVTFGLAEQRVSAVVLPAADAALLESQPGDPAFLFRRVTRRPSGRVIELARSLYRGDRYEIQIRQAPRLTGAEGGTA
jgi:GntR family transcriptional regulator